MEGVWETQSAAPLLLFALPDEEARENRFEVAVPYGASIILTHSLDGVVPGLNDFIAEDGTPLHPPVLPVFWSFRVMVGTGVLMLALSWSAMWFMWRRRDLHAGHLKGHKLAVEGLPKLWLWALVPMSFAGWIATLAGWYTTEIGRQPWLVQGVLTTKAAVAEVPAPMVLSTLIVYLVVYALLIFAYIATITYLAWKASRGEPLSTRKYPRRGETDVVAVPGE